MDQSIGLAEAFFQLLQPDTIIKNSSNNDSSSDVTMMLFYAIFILFIRLIYENSFAVSLATFFGIQNKQRTLEPNDLFEKMYKRNKTPSSKEIKEISKKSDLKIQQVDLWFKRRRNLDRASKIKKFKETSWRFIFYTIIFVFGFKTVYQEPWFWDLKQCWIGYPNQPISSAVHRYYMLEGGFYISLLISLMKDNKRKDFLEQVIHHLSTIALIAFSYSARFVRIGSLIMATHDISDVILEGAKCAFYANKNKLADNCFVLFAIIFLFTRLYIFPAYLLHTVVVDCRQIIPPFTGWYISVLLLVILQLLHIFWAMTILRMAFMMLNKGNVEKDDRSDEDELTADQEADEDTG